MPLNDFNDLHQAAGLIEVKRQLLAGLSPPASDSPAPPGEEPPPWTEGDIPPAGDSSDPSPPPPSEEKALPTESELLARFWLILPEDKVWDAHKRLVLKKTALKVALGKDAFRIWLDSPAKRQVAMVDVRTSAAEAAAEGGGGLSAMLKRMVYLYPTADCYDMDSEQIVTMANLKYAFPRDYEEWLKHPGRRSIKAEQLVFDPTQQTDTATHINMFKGLPFTPHRDDSKCEAILKLVPHLCNNDQVVIDWLYKWLAYPLRHVGAKMATAVVMHSVIQGTGKSLLFEKIMRPMYGEYSATLGQHQLEGQYTDWKSKMLYAVFEEIFSRDQKYSHMGTVKHMVTGETHRIEKKFVSGWEESNHMNSAFLSNEIQPFPVEPSDRRMLTVFARKKLAQDLKDAVMAEVENGGIEAFYSWLFFYPLGDMTTHTEPPMTDAKQQLIDFSRPGWDVFYLEWISGNTKAPVMPCLVEDLFQVYKVWAQRRNESVVSANKFSGFLASQEGVLRRRDVEYNEAQSVTKGTFLVPLDFAEQHRQSKDENQKQWLGRCVVNFRGICGIKDEE